ncbi:nicotinamide riboside transporter PnuC [Colwellia echini]|uniref:Nicotinamide riboside transporter PnuC n=1 Tax=Colwellia echini TaxID=1982103 RepID=A0ABY3MUX7_9GAMM|nr:nicotinamide riboside transporter PnuC [Colwellia echini]TYK65023.1 nicotinamide mononucleotide transporter [Colwellia echini]
MSEIINNVSAYFSHLPWLELIAMLLSLAYVILVAKGNIWCWPAAFISTAIYTVIFFDVKLLMDSALSAYYLLMAVYGYWQWSNPVTRDDSRNDELPITSWALSLHIKISSGLVVITLALGYLVDNYSSASFPYLDTFTTVFAVFSTYLVTQKVLENWLYWIVIDLVSIYLYIEKGLIPTTVLFVIFVVIACYGYIKWLRSYQVNSDDLESTTVS